MIVFTALVSWSNQSITNQGNSSSYGSEIMEQLRQMWCFRLRMLRCGRLYSSRWNVVCYRLHRLQRRTIYFSIWLTNMQISLGTYVLYLHLALPAYKAHGFDRWKLAVWSGWPSFYLPFMRNTLYCTERGTRLFPKFHYMFSWKFHQLVDYNTAAVQPGNI